MLDSILILDSISNVGFGGGITIIVNINLMLDSTLILDSIFMLESILILESILMLDSTSNFGHYFYFWTVL